MRIGRGVGGHGGDLFLGVDLDRHLAQFLDDGLGGHVDAVLDQHRVVAGLERLEAFVDDGVGQDGRGGCAVTGDVVGLGGGFLEKLGAHVLKRIFELNFLGDGNAVVRDGR